MARSENVTVPPDYGTDTGKVFVITRLPALLAEKWGYKMFLAVKGTSGELPASMVALGYVGIALQGINAILASDVDFAKVEPLLDEMLTCVTMIRDHARPEIATPFLPLVDIDEIKTLPWLRSEVLRVHTDFSLADALSTLASAILAASMTDPAASSSTPTSPR